MTTGRRNQDKLPISAPPGFSVFVLARSAPQRTFEKKERAVRCTARPPFPFSWGSNVYRRRRSDCKFSPLVHLPGTQQQVQRIWRFFNAAAAWLPTPEAIPRAIPGRSKPLPVRSVNPHACRPNSAERPSPPLNSAPESPARLTRWFLCSREGPRRVPTHDTSGKDRRKQSRGPARSM